MYDNSNPFTFDRSIDRERERERDGQTDRQTERYKDRIDSLCVRVVIAFVPSTYYLEIVQLRYLHQIELVLNFRHLTF